MSTAHTLFHRATRALRPSGFALAVVSLLSAHAFAAPGDFDASFGGGDGRIRSTLFDQITYQASSFPAEASGQPAIALQPDGKLVIAASCKTGSTFDLCVARFKADGSADTTFGSNGITVTDMRGTNDYVAGVALQPDGKIVVAGTCAARIADTSRDDFCVARLSANGALDTSFGGDGKVFTAMTSFDDTATSMALQADGKIVVAGFCETLFGTTNTCVARYTAIGTLDISFNSDGTAIVRSNSDPLTLTRRTNGIAIAADGKIILAGSVNTGAANSKPNTEVIRLLANGPADSLFASEGFFTVSSTAETTTANAVAIQPDGLIVVAGQSNTSCPSSSVCMNTHRLTTAGTLDTTFGSSGRARLPRITTPQDTGTFTERAYSIALQSDGRIVVAGECSANYTTLGFFRQACVARLRDNGSLDTGIFAGDGGLDFSFAGSTLDPIGFGVAMQPDGKIVLAASCGDLCIARLEGGPFGARNCSLDIDGDGKTIATIDGLIAARVMLGLTSNSVIGGIAFAANATRTEWGTNTSRDIRKYLVTQCGMALP